MIKVHAGGYIWTNLEVEYPLKGVSFESHMHNVNHLVKKKCFNNMLCFQLEKVLNSGLFLMVQ